jgi:RNA polymerase sigma-70 factor (ECF subfamily)
VGIEEVMRLHAGLARRFALNVSRIVRYAMINGLPGFVTVEADETLQTTALEIVDGKVIGIYIVRNPDKLRHLESEGVH